MTKAARNLAVDIAIIAVLVFCFSAVAAHCQSLPDAPSSSSEHRICYTNADSKGTMAEIPCDQVPRVSKARDWSPIVIIPPKQPGFWTLRKSWQDPPLRTSKEVLHSKTFLILNTLYAVSVVTDVEYTHGRAETRISEYPAMVGVIGLDYVMDRFFTRAYSVEGPIYGIQHYVRDAFRGR